MAGIDLETIGIAAFLIDVLAQDTFSIVGFNDSLAALTGVRREDVASRTPRDGLGAEFADLVEPRYREVLRTRQVYEYEEELKLPSGHKWWRTTLIPILDAETGLISQILGVPIDITARRLDDLAMIEAASIDALTGIANRRRFDSELATSISAGAEIDGASTLMLIDIDHFKIINDTHGHATGDDLLQEIATRLCGCARSSDLVARIGGDEFAVVFRGTETSASIMSKALQVLDAVRQPVMTVCGPIVATASIGVAVSDGTVDRAEDLLRRADLALYRSKDLGRNQAQTYGQAWSENVAYRRKDLEAIREAIELRQLEVFYQPIVDLRTDMVRGMEALVRWNHPTRGILPPAVFEAAFSDPKLSLGIDDFVLEKSLAQMREWIDRGIPIAAVNVNVCQAQLQRDDLVEHVAARLAAHRLPAERLKIEVVETAFLGRDASKVARTIERMARMGVVCALDDFGMGYASLSHLRQFRVERIKIDRSFVANICSNTYDRGLTRSLIDLGRNLGIRVTAEGVETAEQLALLKEFSCDCAQGYFIGKPVPAGEVPRLLSNWHYRQSAA